MVNQNAFDVNSFKISEARLCCIYFLPMLSLLRSRQQPEIAFPFLLDNVDFASKYTDAMNAVSSWKTPWRNGYGRLFWRRYAPSQAPEDMWRALVPIEYSLEGIVGSLTASDGTAESKALIYPWGIGLLIDITLKGSWPTAEAVDRLIELRNRPKIAWKLGTDTGQASPDGVASEIQKRLVPSLYLANEAEPLGEQFSIATVIDGDNLVASDPVSESGPLHQVLEALTGWKSQWQQIRPDAKAMETSKLPSASAPAGHILYGKNRSRAVWFPANFRSIADYPDSLCCYHQNLSTATLHTEALCVLSQDVAAQLSTKGGLADFSSAYRNCAKLAAGLLGRLHGRKSDDSTIAKPLTYRSGSVRRQILSHKDEINLLRTTLLNGGTALDA